jgi:hypothetical protein
MDGLDIRRRLCAADKVPLICIAFSVAQRRFATIDGRGYRIHRFRRGFFV